MKIKLYSESAERVRKQTGVIPYRLTSSNELEVLLISSSHTGSWGFPKGKKENHLGKRESALVEAWEEAGLKGKTKQKLGTIEYRKGSTGVKQSVIYFAMKVNKVHDTFPEQWRKRKWFTLAKALTKVNKSHQKLLHTLEEIV